MVEFARAEPGCPTVKSGFMETLPENSNLRKGLAACMAGRESDAVPFLEAERGPDRGTPTLYCCLARGYCKQKRFDEADKAYLQFAEATKNIERRICQRPRLYTRPGFWGALTGTVAMFGLSLGLGLWLRDPSDLGRPQ